MYKVIAGSLVAVEACKYSDAARKPLWGMLE